MVSAGRMEMGRLHERPGGPHPIWSCQLAFTPAQFAAVVGFMAEMGLGFITPRRRW